MSETFSVWFLIGAALVFWMQAGFSNTHPTLDDAKEFMEKHRNKSLIVYHE